MKAKIESLGTLVNPSGIDISSSNFSACFLIDGKPFYNDFPQTLDGFTSFLNTFKMMGCDGVGFESTGAYHKRLQKFLIENEINPFVLSPRRVHFYLKSQKRILGKTDKSDSYGIALYLTKNDDSLIINFLNNIRPKLYGLFTCQPSFSITSVDQIVPFSVSFGGSLLPNADGSITLPANATYLIDFEVNGSYSVSSSSTYYIYDCDTGNNIFSVTSISENNTTTNDGGELRVSELAVGSAPRRIGVKVYTKQVSGTLILSQYQTFIKVVEV